MEDHLVAELGRSLRLMEDHLVEAAFHLVEDHLVGAAFHLMEDHLVVVAAFHLMVGHLVEPVAFHPMEDLAKDNPQLKELQHTSRQDQLVGRIVVGLPDLEEEAWRLVGLLRMVHHVVAVLDNLEEPYCNFRQVVLVALVVEACLAVLVVEAFQVAPVVGAFLVVLVGEAYLAVLVVGASLLVDLQIAVLEPSHYLHLDHYKNS
mmetsp:Transcript_8016/g.12552  ORF Transcript_8016/g.12552 Transcript_8016/m.12552 type:complete len:204 (+) Transcript_8016:465-1076(+)